MSDSRVTPAWNFKGMLMENNSRVITNADATLTQKIYDYGEVSPEQSSVTVVKDDDIAHFYFNICSEKGEPAYIKITKDDDGNIVITGTDHSGTTQQTILASKIELTENDKGVLISVLATENGELIKKEAQIYDSTISVEERDYGALITMTNSKGTSSEAKLYSPTIFAERLEDNTGVKIIITSGKEGATPTVVNLYDPIITGKRVTGGVEITIQNHIDEEPQIINLYDAGSSSIAPEYDETQEYKKFNYCIYNNTLYVCLEDTTGPFDETKWQETKVSYELDNVSLKIVAEDWNGSKTYSIGDYVMYDKILYKCISNEEGSETAYPDITTSKWETIFIMDEIPNVATTEKAGIVKVGNNLSIEEDGTLSANADLSIIAEEWDKTKTYSIGDYVLYKNILYKCISDEEGYSLDFSNAISPYYVHTAGQDIINNGGYHHYKQNNEDAAGGWYWDSNHYLVTFLVSDLGRDAVTITRNPSTSCKYEEIEFLGKTIYIGSVFQTSGGPSSGPLYNAQVEYYSNREDFLMYFLKKARVMSASTYPDITITKWQPILVMDEIKNKQSTVPIASTETAGIVKVGKNLEITEDGTLNAKAGGGNANEMELTWAEYLALTDEEKNNGTTYYITDKNPTSSEKGFKSTLLATLNDQPQEIDFSNYDLILYQAYNSEVNLYSSAVFMPSFINRAGNIILSIDVTDRIIIDSTNAITLNAFNCAIDVYGMNFVGSGGEGGASSLTDLTDVYIQNLEDKQILSYNSSAKRWENIETNFSSDAKYAKLYFNSDNSNTVKPTSTTAPLVFDNIIGNLEVIDNQKIKLEKGKIYLAYAQGQKGNWSGSLYILIKNSQEQIVSQSGADNNYTGVSVSTIYKCEIDNDYLYYSSSNGQGTDGGSSRAFTTQFFVVELNGGSSESVSGENGAVAIVPKGDFVNGTQYTRLDLVTYEGNGYIAKKDNINVLPTDTTNWMLAWHGTSLDIDSRVEALETEILPANTALNKNFETSTDAIKMDGLVSVGTSNNIPRADHVHPTDTTRLSVTGDSKDVTTTFTSGDASQATAWEDVSVLTTGEKHSSIFNKMSTMFKNIRYIYTHFIKSENILDTLEQISANTESGRVAGALAVKSLNSNLNNIFTYSSAKATNVAISNGNIMCYRDGKTVNLSGLFQVSKSGNVATIPASFRPKGVIVCSIIKDGGVGCRAHIESDGTINPQNQLETGAWYTLSTAYVI